MSSNLNKVRIPETCTDYLFLHKYKSPDKNQKNSDDGGGADTGGSGGGCDDDDVIINMFCSRFCICCN